MAHNFQKALWNGKSSGVGGQTRKKTSVEGFGYFLEPHNET